MPYLTRCLVTAFMPPDPDAERVLTAIARLRGRIGPIERFARSLGYSSRHQLAHRVTARGLPSIERMVQWTFVLWWVLEWEERQVPLQELARREQRDPAIYYRLVKRVTGRTWTMVRAAGSGWVMGEARRTDRRTDGRTDRSYSRSTRNTG